MQLHPSAVLTSFAALVALTLAAPASAQRVAQAANAGERGDACTDAFVTPDTASVPLFWLLQPVHVPKDSLTEENILQHARILQELRTQYRHPTAEPVAPHRDLLFRRSEAELLSDPTLELPRAGPAHPVVSGVVEFTLLADGRVLNVNASGAWAAPALLFAMADAVERAGEARVLETLAERTLPDRRTPRGGVRMRLVLHDARDSLLAFLPIGDVQLPQLEMQSLRVSRMVPPRYPSGFAADDELVAYIVVDARGRPEPGSFRVVQGGFRATAEEARRAILRWEFEPARIGDCAVRQEALVPLTFRREQR